MLECLTVQNSTERGHGDYSAHVPCANAYRLFLPAQNRHACASRHATSTVVMARQHGAETASACRYPARTAVRPSARGTVHIVRRTVVYRTRTGSRQPGELKNKNQKGEAQRIRPPGTSIWRRQPAAIKPNYSAVPPNRCPGTGRAGQGRQWQAVAAVAEGRQAGQAAVEGSGEQRQIGTEEVGVCSGEQYGGVRTARQRWV